MSKKKHQGHYCRICGCYRANEKFSGKGHRRHICKDCNRDQQAQKLETKQVTKQAFEVGLPAPKRYPMTRYQAASYLDITPSAFDYRRKKLELEPCGTYEGKQGTGFLFNMETIIAVHQYSQTDNGEAE
jgi:hypothetical protein